MALSTGWKLALGAGALAVLSKKGAGVVSTVDSGALTRAFDWAKQSAFGAVLPKEVARYAPELLKSAAKYDVNPFILAGIMYRESLGGNALKPPNPGGSGGFVALKGIPGADANGFPDDGKGGWDRGLMQINYSAHLSWFKGGAKWWEPQVNIDKGAEVFAAAFGFFGRTPTTGVRVSCSRINTWRTLVNKPYPVCQSDGRTAPLADPRPLSGRARYEAALAAYNAGAGAVLQALAVGLPPDIVTTGRNYGNSIAGWVAKWYSSTLG